MHSNDPLRRPGAANLGAAGLGRDAPTHTRWELGDVVEYNSATHTAVVKTHSGRPLRDVPQMKSTAGAFDHLESGLTVVISWDIGIPIIIGIIDFVGAQQAAVAPPSLTGVEGYGDSDPTQPTDGFNSYKPPTAPTDMQQGDWAQVGAAGNHVAVLAGAVTLMGSPTAQVRSMGVSGTLQHVSRRAQTVTDWGTWQTFNDQGKTSFILRAGSSQATETGMDEQNWGIRLDLGATGDVLDFSITEPQGQVLFRLHAGSDGRVQIYGDGGVDVSSGSRGTSERRDDVAGNRVATVGGSDTTTVGGNESLQIDGGLQTQVGGDEQHVVGGAQTSLVTGDRTESVGGKYALSAVGDTSVTTDGDLTVLTNGEATVTAARRALVDGATVVLGATGQHPLPLFDVFLADLSQFLTTDLPAAISGLTPDPTSAATLAQALANIALFAAKVTAALNYESTKVFND